MKRTTNGAIRAAALVLLLTIIFLPLASKPVQAQSANVVIIGGTTLDTANPCSYGAMTDANAMVWTYGGCLPVTGPVGELGDFTFTAMDPSAVSAASLAPFDTAVLNVASYAMACDTNILTASQKADLVAFVASGKKLIIYDSECTPSVDYSWLPYPFTTANPGAMGAPGTLTIVEENTLSSNDAMDPYYIDANDLSVNTDAVGDMNVMTTYDPNWCLDMSGTNFLNVTGPVHTYAKYPSGTDIGLFVYNGLDQDYQYLGNPNLRNIWLFELQQPFNPSNLPCGYTVVGITLDPASATNEVDEDHMVTATLSDLLGNPQPGILVTFSVVSGPNAGASGTCSPNVDCTTDANGQVSFTYTGSGGVGNDAIEACFINQEGDEVCSQPVTKEWTLLPVVEVSIDIKPGSCPNSFNVKSNGVLPVAVLGTEDFDVTTIDPETIRLTREPVDDCFVQPIRWSYEDVATPFEGELCDCHDLNGDGYMDLTLKFDTQELVRCLALEEVAGETIPLTLTGNLKEEDGGTPITGEDCLRILNPGGGKK